MPTNKKEVRILLNEGVHAGVRALADHEGVTMDRWVGDLVTREVAKNLAIARRLVNAVSQKDLLESATPNWRAAAKRIYFVQRGESGPIKIGAAVEVERRISVLQCGSAEQLRVLAIIDEAHGVTEKSLHRRFRELKRGGEWFEPAAALLTFIASLAKGSVNA